VKDILQRKLLGKAGESGTGLLPRDSIVRTSPGFIPEAVESIWVRHASGGISVVQFKSYDQGREAFQGTEQDIVWLDEEPPQPVYTECLLRTMTNDGCIMLTFTPLRGLSDVVLSFMPELAPEPPKGPDGEAPKAVALSKAVVTATWDDVPHLTEKQKAEILAGVPPYLRGARSKGIPQLGAGLIYPLPESAYVVDPFEIPKHWPRAYGLDVGWNRTAAIFGAWDRETDTAYIYSEHYMGEAEPAVHASAIKARGPIPGAIDPAAKARSQLDGRNLMQLYREQGLELVEADHAVEAGLFATYERYSTGRLKVFRTCQNLINEQRLYRRDERGKVVKERDHAMDAERYFVMTGLRIARAPTPIEPKPEFEFLSDSGGGGAWMG
jgi:phage terminase large subunit-like protein